MIFLGRVCQFKIIEAKMYITYADMPFCSMDMVASLTAGPYESLSARRCIATPLLIIRALPRSVIDPK